MNTSSVTLAERSAFTEEQLRVLGYDIYYPSIGGELGDPFCVNRRYAINMATNNYLGLANDPRIKEAYIDGIYKYGTSMCATPVAGGYTDQFEAVEAALAPFIGVERLLLYPSCYQANNGLFSALATEDDLVLFDRGAHSSLIQGILPVGCAKYPFAHNDPDALEYLLRKKTGYAHVFVVTESVFSTEGSIAPFAEINALCKRYGATPVVDDSHGIGVLGAHGGGILDHCGITDYDGLYTTSLGKAIANNCGVVGGPRRVIDYMRYLSSHLVYSTAVAPCILSGLLRTLDILELEYRDRIERVYRYRDTIRAALRAAGFTVVDGAAPINSIVAGPSEETVRISKALMQRGVLTTPFVFPSVPKNKGRVRMIAGANLAESTIAYVCTALDGIHHNLYDNALVA
ncbi:MAG: pyridoxal phosphate-dependent aminotransferase family protein [Bacteroidetes bacterium]|nr:pyridoxal phosphate-dependent aminotransferase family protein [Bacteroidota bacterium]